LSADYVRHWFAHHALRTTTPTLRALARKWIEQADEARPGFAEQLRIVALDAISGSDPDLARRGLVALSVVGTEVDLAMIEGIGAGINGLAADARYAAFEIKQRAV
jgi:hypothetical protein